MIQNREALCWLCTVGPAQLRIQPTLSVKLYLRKGFAGTSLLIIDKTRQWHQYPGSAAQGLPSHLQCSGLYSSSRHGLELTEVAGGVRKPYPLYRRKPSIQGFCKWVGGRRVATKAPMDTEEWSHMHKIRASFSSFCLLAWVKLNL